MGVLKDCPNALSSKPTAESNLGSSVGSKTREVDQNRIREVLDREREKRDSKA